MAPIIGITACRSLADYLESVSRFGGEPRPLQPGVADVDRIVSEIQGLLLTGGEDVDPALYGEARHPNVVDVDRERDLFELALVRRALEADRPVFGICRGAQVLNVAFGGTLIQDIPTEVASPLEHRIATPKYALAHPVWVDDASLLARLLEDRLLEGDTCSVNSRHHQAVKTVAEGFSVTATAPDGVIEAIERPDARFCLAVQWHPENFWRTGEFRPLFEAFLDACRL